MSRVPVKDTSAMISGMAPVCDQAIWHFCTTTNTDQIFDLQADALAVFVEDEGTSLILPDETARAHGFAVDMPMARITLMVHSALDGVGLTAAVAAALAEAGIACNMVAAFHHDHAFVPWERRDEALALLRALAAGEVVR